MPSQRAQTSASANEVQDEFEIDDEHAWLIGHMFTVTEEDEKFHTHK